MALRLVFLTAAAVAVALDQVGLAVVMAALAVLGGTPTYPAIAAALPSLAGPDRVRATELLVTIEVSAWVVGPALGGLMLAPALRPWTLAAAVVLAAVGFAFSTGITIPGPVEKAPDAVGGMLRTVLSSAPALGALGLAGLLNLVITITGLVLLPLSMDVWRTGEAGFGATTACLGFGALGAPLLARLARRTGGATRTRGLVLVALAVLVVAVTPVPWPVAPRARARRRRRRGRRECGHDDAPGRRTGPLPRRCPRPDGHRDGRRLPGRQPGRAGARRALRRARPRCSWSRS